MQPVKILTGTIATLTPELAARFGIRLVPYYVSYGGRAYAEGRDLDRGYFCHWLRQEKGFPTTSPSSLEEFIEAFRHAEEEAEAIIYVSIAPVYSKSYSLARRAKERLRAAGLRCIVEDATNPEWAERVAERIGKEFVPEELWRLLTSAAVVAHAGLGTWGVAWYCRP